MSLVLQKLISILPNVERVEKKEEYEIELYIYFRHNIPFYIRIMLFRYGVWSVNIMLKKTLTPYYVRDLKWFDGISFYNLVNYNQVLESAKYVIENIILILKQLSKEANERIKKENETLVCMESLVILGNYLNIDPLHVVWSYLE